MTTSERFRWRVDQELPSIPFRWYRWDTTTDTWVIDDLSTGWTGTIKVSSPDRPNTVLTTLTGVTLAATDPPFVWTANANDGSTLVTAWGKPLRERGTTFLFTPFLDRTSDGADRYWPDDPVPVLVLPALA